MRRIIFNPRVDKADSATLAFACAGLWGWLARTPQPADLPLAVFYAVLLVNTRCSIAFFSGIIPRRARGQRSIDLVLALLYVALAGSLHRPIPFAALTCLLFLVATLKYLALLDSVPYRATLIRKIRIDLCGAVMAAAAAAGMMLYRVTDTAWALAFAFALANLYLLVVEPMYRILDCDLCLAGGEEPLV